MFCEKPILGVLVRKKHTVVSKSINAVIIYHSYVHNYYNWDIDTPNVSINIGSIEILIVIFLVGYLE